MKKTFLTAAFSVMTVVAFAQKKEIRNAEKALKKGNYTEAKSNIQQAEASIAGAKESLQADFYYTKAMAYLGGENNNNYEDLVTASQAMKKALELGSKEAEQGIAVTKNRLVSSAIEDQNQENYAKAAEKLLASYEMDKNDTIYLYYAASNYVNAQDYDRALKHYVELRDLGFTGEETQYLATNKETGEVEAFTKQQRDLMLKTGSYINPEDKTTPAKTGEIAKNIALIHIQNGDNEKARQAMEDAKKANPDDHNLMLVEADMYYNMGDMEKYKELMTKITEKDPDNPILFFNLGVSAAQSGQNEEAIKYYKRALELDPNLENANINLAYAILSQEQAIVEEMNSLGTSAADNKRYDQLGKERQKIYAEALPYLKAALQSNPEDVEVVRTLMNIHYQLGQDKEAEQMKAKLDQLRG